MVLEYNISYSKHIYVL